MRETAVGPRARTASGRLLAVLVVLVVVFATGVGPRPDGETWAAFYDLWLYNLVYAGAAVVCLLAARRNRGERLAWTSLAAAIMLSTRL